MLSAQEVVCITRDANSIPQSRAQASLLHQQWQYLAAHILPTSAGCSLWCLDVL